MSQTNYTTENPFKNGTETTEEKADEGFKIEELIRTIIFAITVLIALPIGIYLKLRNTKQRRERAERRARNLENQQNQGQYNSAFATDYSVRY